MNKENIILFFNNFFDKKILNYAKLKCIFCKIIFYIYKIHIINLLICIFLYLLENNTVNCLIIILNFLNLYFYWTKKI